MHWQQGCLSLIAAEGGVWIGERITDQRTRVIVHDWHCLASPIHIVL